MAIELDGVSERIDYAAIYAPVGNPLSVACRINLSSLGVNEYIFFIETGATGFGLTFWISDLGAGVQRLTATMAGSTDLSVSTVAAGFSANTWHDVILTWDGSLNASGVIMYVDNTALGTTVTQNGISLSAMDGNWIIGGRATDNNRNLTGRVADLGAWSAVLTAQQRTDFGAGLPPALVRSANLQFDTRFVDGSLVDAVSAGSGTAIGTPVSYANPTSVCESEFQIPALIFDAGVDSGAAAGNAVNAEFQLPALTFDAGLTSTSGPTIIDGFIGSTVNAASSSVGGTAADPELTIVNNLNAGGTWRTMVGRAENLEGVSSFKIIVDSTNLEIPYTGGPTPPFFWRLASGDFDDWVPFDSTVLVGATLTATHNTAPAGPIIFSDQPAMFSADMRAIITGAIAADSNVTSLVPGAPTTGVFNTLVAVTGTNGVSLPATTQSAMQIWDSSGPVQAGLIEPLEVIHMGGTHSHEHIGAQAWYGAQLRARTGPIAARQNIKHHFIEVNPQGRDGGNQDTGTDQLGSETVNSNREWDTSILNCLVAVKDYISTYVDTNKVVMVIDYHNLLSGTTGQTTAIFYIAARPLTQTFVTAMDTAYLGAVIREFEGSIDGGICANYWYDTFGIPGVTLEQDRSSDPLIQDYRDWGAAVVDALQAMVVAGDFPAKHIAGEIEIPALTFDAGVSVVALPGSIAGEFQLPALAFDSSLIVSLLPAAIDGEVLLPGLSFDASMSYTPPVGWVPVSTGSTETWTPVDLN